MLKVLTTTPLGFNMRPEYTFKIVLQKISTEAGDWNVVLGSTLSLDPYLAH